MTRPIIDNRGLALLALLAVGLVLSATLRSDGVDLPHQFTAGTPAMAEEVNANFEALRTVIVQQQATIDALQDQLNDLDGQMAGVNNSAIMALGDHLEEISSNNFAFSGINLHLRNGEGETASSNSLGNLIIGYNEPRTSGDTSIGRGGSHYLVVGRAHQWSSYGGIVVGQLHIATGSYGSVSGGYNNAATGVWSSVSGGRNNIAAGHRSSVSGGENNTATGQSASISGGLDNTATGHRSSISGGENNTATGQYASISGGSENQASGESSSVSGGLDNSALGVRTSVSGGLLNEANSPHSSISGGFNNTTNGSTSSILGGANQTTNANFQTIPSTPQ